jgi:hypothetical protein
MDVASLSIYMKTNYEVNLHGLITQPRRWRRKLRYSRNRVAIGRIRELQQNTCQEKQGKKCGVDSGVMGWERLRRRSRALGPGSA